MQPSSSTAEPPPSGERIDRIAAAGARETLDRIQGSELVGTGAVNMIGIDAIADKLADQWQRKGLGTEMTKRLIQIAKHEKLGRLVAYTLRENKDMQQMCKKVGFKVRTPVGESECVIEMDL